MKHLSLMALACFTLMACAATLPQAWLLNLTFSSWAKIGMRTQSQEKVRFWTCNWCCSRSIEKTGFKVIDETMATNNSFTQGRVRRTNSELFKIAKAIQTPPIDAVVTFKIYPYFKADNTTIWWMQGQPAVYLMSQQMPYWEHLKWPCPKKLPQSPAVTKTEPALKYMGNHSRNLGQELGSALLSNYREQQSVMFR